MAQTRQDSKVKGFVERQLLGTLNDAFALVQRYRELDGLRRHVRKRLHLVLPALALILATGFACAMAAVMLFLGPQALSSLLGLLLAPVVLAGSLFVMLTMFFSWVEERSLARSLGHRTGPAPGKFAIWTEAKLGADLGRLPRVPWLLALVFVVLPLGVLTQLAPKTAALLIVVWVAGPVLYARYDR